MSPCCERRSGAVPVRFIKCHQVFQPDGDRFSVRIQDPRYTGKGIGC